METIKIAGINRDPRNDSQGACSEIINMRFKDGAWSPVGKKRVETGQGTPPLSIIFIHTVDEDTDTPNVTKGKNYLAYNNTTGNVITWELATPGNPLTISNIGAGKSQDISFVSLKNVVTIIDRKDKKLHYLLWNGVYTYLDNKFPELLPLNYRIDSRTWTDVYNRINQDSFLAKYNQRLVAQRKLGYDQGYTQVRYAYELFDGSIVAPSAPQFMYLADNRLDVMGSPSHVIHSLYGFDALNQTLFTTEELRKLIMKVGYGVIPGTANLTLSVGRIDMIYKHDATGDAILAKLKGEYKDIVKNIVVFMTKPVPCQDVNKLGDSKEYNPATNGVGGLTLGDQDGIPYKDALNQEIYYRYATISIADIVAGQDKDIILKPGDLNSWETREVMPQDDFTHHTISAAANMVYNGRLVLGDITTKLFKGFAPEYFMYPRRFARKVEEVVGQDEFGNDILNWVYYDDVDLAVADPFSIELYVHIMTEEGAKIVLHTSNKTYTFRYYRVNPVISYPDVRAGKIDIVKVVGNTRHLIGSYNLTRHPYQNIAHAIIQEDYTHPVFFDFVPAEPVVYTVPAVMNNTYGDSNMVKMSAPNNPMLFPSKNSYLVGLSRVLGFEVNAIPISQGQFGQHPIMVFTATGMWAMELGGGGTTIATIVPLNDYVCTIPSAIIRAGGMIVFPTAEGLIGISGGDDVLLSQPLRGEYSSPIGSDPGMTAFIDHDQLVKLTNAISKKDFISYLKDPITQSVAHIGFDQNNRELIVSNPAHDYSYVYSFTNNVWTKITERFQYFVSDYPKTYGVDVYNNIVDLGTEEKTGTETLIISRPIFYDNNMKVERFGVKAKIDSTEGKIAGFYLFGSEDGRRWKFITGVQKEGDFNNPYVNRSLMSFKEAIIVMAGKFDPETWIKELTLAVKPRYTNKPIR